ncbi:hypothetical protein [Lacticaseibacillus absianus]|uniref:hypothetical protein n=1 Tax=Lacticaseibacillus absianus TaxID=2729623 RepID=UPI0015CC19C4|nr:hypothetical protein [Lacticaseibacillus absianus]
MKFSSFDWVILGFAACALALLITFHAAIEAVVVAALMVAVVALDRHQGGRQA